MFLEKTMPIRSAQIVRLTRVTYSMGISSWNMLGVSDTIIPTRIPLKMPHDIVHLLLHCSCFFGITN